MPPGRMAPGTIFVLAGPNGAGKSSIGGARLRALGYDYVNIDERSARILNSNPGMPLAAAQSIAWRSCVEELGAAITAGSAYALETTLGGHTITRMLLEAAAGGTPVHVWYAGLDSPQRHLARIASRVAAGGHDIDEARVRHRYSASLGNLVILIPRISRLDVFDNSAEADPKTGARPTPLRVVAARDGQLVFPATGSEVKNTPAWARPVVMAALHRWTSSLAPR